MADRISEDYKALGCYKHMKEAYQKQFDALASYYGPMLNRGPSKRHIIYTLHDFDHHCYDIYQIISNFILGEEGLEQLSGEERYLLNLSVLFHDISMCKGGYENKEKTAFNRDFHSLQSSQWLQHEYDDSNSVLHTCGKLTPQQMKMLCDICQAHSDVKNHPLSNSEDNGILNEKLQFSEEGRSGKVRVKALAGVLRLADELDVTSARLGNSGEEDDLLPDDKDDQESKKHWERLHLIISLKFKNPSTLYLVLDEAKVKERMDKGDELSVRKDLTEIKDKIEKELKSFRDVVIEQHKESARLITLNRVEMHLENSPLLHRLFPIEPVILPELSSSCDGMPEDNSDAKGEGSEETSVSRKINLLSPELSTRIKQYVYDQELLAIGHYQLNGTYCARDWINTLDLLNKSELTNEMIRVFSDHISKRYSAQKYTIVGLDIAGTIGASKIAFALNKPFTYVIPVHHRELADGHEVNVPDINDGDGIILITDCIVTGSTVSRVIQDNHWEGQVLAIYSIFYREPKRLSADEILPLEYSINVLNQDFSAEVSYVKDCPYGSTNCRATNKKYDGGAI